LIFILVIIAIFSIESYIKTSSGKISKISIVNNNLEPEITIINYLSCFSKLFYLNFKDEAISFSTIEGDILPGGITYIKPAINISNNLTLDNDDLHWGIYPFETEDDEIILPFNKEMWQIFWAFTKGFKKNYCKEYYVLPITFLNLY